MILRLLLSFCVGLTFVTASHAAIEDQVSEFMLDNGMQVVVIEDHRATVVVHMVWYRAGAADENTRRIRRRAFFGTSVIQENQKPCGGRTVPNGGREWRDGQRLYQLRLHCLLPTRRGGQITDHDADGGGSDGQLGPYRTRYSG